MEMIYQNEEGKEISFEEFKKLEQESTDKFLADAKQKREDALAQLAKATGVDIETLRLI